MSLKQTGAQPVSSTSLSEASLCETSPHETSPHETSLLRLILSLGMLCLGSATLIATSPADIPSVDQSIELKIAEGEERVDLAVVYTSGPVNFNDYPLVLSVEIDHEDPAETFNFEAQSWTLVTETPEGESRRQLVVLERGDNAQFAVDQETLKLSGVVSLNACEEDTGASSVSDPLCIPCSIKGERCEFTLSMIRQGAPYPAEIAKLDLSQWTSEGASFKLNVSRR